MLKKRFILVVLLVFLLFSLFVNAQSQETSVAKLNGELTVDKKALGNLKEGTFEFSSKTNALGDLTFETDNLGEKSKVTIDQEILKNLEDISIGGDVGGYYLLVKMKNGKSQEERKFVPISDIGSLSELRIPFSGRFESTLESLGNRLRLTFDSTTEKNIPVKSGGLPVKTDKGLLVSNEKNLNAFETEWILSAFQRLNKNQFPIETKEILATLKEQGQEFTGNLEFIFGEQAAVVSINTGELSSSLKKQLNNLYEKGLRGRISLNTRTDEEGKTEIAMMDLEKAKIKPFEVATAISYNPLVVEAQNAPVIIRKRPIEIELLGQIDGAIQNLDKSVYTSQLSPISFISASTKILDPVSPTSLNDLIKQKQKEVEELRTRFKKDVDAYGLYSKSSNVANSQTNLKRGELELKQLNKMTKKINKEEKKQKR